MTRSVRTKPSPAPTSHGEPGGQPQAPPASSWLPPEIAAESDRESRMSDRESRIADARARSLAAAAHARRRSSTLPKSDRGRTSSWLPPGEYEAQPREPQREPDES